RAPQGAHRRKRRKGGMNRRLKVATLAAMFAGFVAMAGAYDLGFERWPPQAALANGVSVPFRPADVQACFKMRMMGLFGDCGAEAYWRTCQRQLIAYQALGAFEGRSMIVVGCGVVGLLALFGFAVCVRTDRAAFKVIRGARLRAGTAGLKAFARACANECKVHGHGVALVPPIPLSRDRETRHFLILGSVGGGKTQTMLHLIIEAISRDDSVLVLDTKGDMMAALPGDPGPLLVAPHDQRSLVWDVAADCC